jgi:hypothetical protein
MVSRMGSRPCLGDPRLYVSGVRFRGSRT